MARTVEGDDLRRAMTAVAKGCTRLQVGVAGRVRICGRDGSGTTVAATVLDEMASRGLVRRAGEGVAVTEAGTAFLRRAAARDDPFQEQHRIVDERMLEADGARVEVRVNVAESPLAALARRKDRTGRPFLDAREFEAGERLRCDYQRAQIMPSIGARWDSAISSGRRAGAAADLSDGALAARQRVEAALDAVGPELTGVLVDICCFLKGFEAVESERGWPVRSAKIVLKTALGVLARHYDPGLGRDRARRTVLKWGAADHRPPLQTVGG